jgi:hypothetical protein
MWPSISQLGPGGGGTRVIVVIGGSSKADKGGWRPQPEEPGERGEKRRHPDETEIGSNIQHPKVSDYSYNIGDEDNEDP